MFQNKINLTEKQSKKLRISFKVKNKKVSIVPMGAWILKNKKFIKTLNSKRKKYNKFFLNEISSDLGKTRNYLKNISDSFDICFFLIKSSETNIVGIIGLKKRTKKFEIYFVLKLAQNSFMNLSMINLIKWSSKKYKIKNYIVKVFSNNKNAKKLYENIGFKYYYKNYLKKKKINKFYRHFIVNNKLNSNVNYSYQTLKLNL